MAAGAIDSRTGTPQLCDQDHRWMDRYVGERCAHGGPVERR